MKEKVLSFSWLGMYILCAGLGTITQRSVFGSVILTILSLVFFIPPAILLYQGLTSQNHKILFRIRMISLASLSLTLCLIILHILTVFANETIGKFLNDLLIVISAPMFCCAWQWVSLFLCACLFVSSFPKMWKK